MQARALQGRARSSLQRGNTEDALGFYESSERVLELEPLTTRTEAIAGKANCLRMMGEVKYAIHILESHLAALVRENVTDPDSVMRLNASLAIPYLQSGLESDASRAATEALRIAPLTHNPEARADMYMNVARIFLAKGDVEEAQRALSRAEATYAELEFQTELGECFLAEGIVASRVGKTAKARSRLLKARDIFDRTQSAVNRVRVLNELARLKRLGGHRNEARAMLEDSVEMLGADADQGVLGWIFRELGLCDMVEDPARAEKSLRRAIELFERTNEENDLASSYRLLGDVLVEIGDAAGGCETYRTGLMAIEKPF